MADPFSITAGIAGIAAPALHGTRILLDDLRKISDAPALVKALEGDISLVFNDELADSVWLGEHSLVVAGESRVQEVGGDPQRAAPRLAESRHAHRPRSVRGSGVESPARTLRVCVCVDETIQSGYGRGDARQRRQRPQHGRHRP